jgi:uncharacterized membrane-anchored protein YhcB (DUF1043 family)
MLYFIIGFAIGIFIGVVIAMISTGNCKIIKRFKKSGETDIYKYIMENEVDNPNLKSMDVKDEENKE